MHMGARSAVTHTHMDIYPRTPHFHAYNLFFVALSPPAAKILYFHWTLIENVLLSKKEDLVI